MIAMPYIGLRDVLSHAIKLYKALSPPTAAPYCAPGAAISHLHESGQMPWHAAQGRTQKWPCSFSHTGAQHHCMRGSCTTMPTCKLSVTQPRLTVTPVMGIRPLSETSLSEDLAVFAIQKACPYSPRTCSVITMGAAGWGRQVKLQMQMQAADDTWA